MPAVSAHAVRHAQLDLDPTGRSASSDTGDQHQLKWGIGSDQDYHPRVSGRFYRGADTLGTAIHRSQNRAPIEKNTRRRAPASTVCVSPDTVKPFVPSVPM